MENLTLFAQNHPLLPSFFSNYCICAHNIKRCLDVKVVYNLVLLQTKGYTNEHQGNTENNDIMLRTDNQ